ncbi:MAG: MgtC/SapB family protein [Betaproteobacteria bacterium]|nr:MAG: MgtC/SapB family protein [Betaproteobacteria bacterium]
MELTWLEGTDIAHLPAFAASLAIGLLIGLERERHPGAKAGLRTFALVALLAAVLAFLGDALATPWMLIVGLVLVGGMIISAHARGEAYSEPGTTTVIALLVCFGLSAMVWYGQVRIAVMLAVVTVILLYFKTELRGMTRRLTRRDLISMLQFAVLTLVILPLLPDQSYGRYGVLNPYQIWLIVVLISGISLAGYVALRLVGQRYGAPLLGFLGGLVSSTATTLVYARHARGHEDLQTLSVFVIVIANIVVLIRLAVLCLIVSPAMMATLLPILSAGFLAGGLALLYLWGRTSKVDDAPVPDIKNPTELKTAFSFAVVYAVVVFLSAWLSDIAGDKGLYGLALISGLTDVDAIALSALRLFNLEQQGAHTVAIAIVLAVLSNMAFKLAMVLVVGGNSLFQRCAIAIGAVATGLIIGAALI